MTNYKSDILSQKPNSNSDSIKKYDLNNLPPINLPSFIIEYEFLRNLKTGKIPQNIKDYLNRFNEHDWTCLLAHNPRPEFLDYLDNLDKEIISKISWRYIIETIKYST